jgi:hypothetical protein
MNGCPKTELFELLGLIGKFASKKSPDIEQKRGRTREQPRFPSGAGGFRRLASGTAVD